MKKGKICSSILAVCMACLLTMTSCSAAEIPGAGVGTDSDSVNLTAESQPVFSDVPADADYAQAVSWCREQGVMQGVSADRFAPDSTLTRAMVASVLYRDAGEPAVTGNSAFTDVPAGRWYSDAIVWAAGKEIVGGYGDGRFGPDDPVTKEQLDIMVRRYGGETPVWTGDAARSAPATRAEAAAAFYDALKEDGKMYLQIGDTVWTATLEDNPSVTAWKELLSKGPLTVDMSDYGGFEKVGSIGADLTQSNRQITTKPGDIILYQGSNVTVYYGENSWNFTLLGHIDGVTEAELREVLKAGGENIRVTFSLEEPAQGVTARAFDFQHKSVTLNSGYEMPLNGLGTYSLHGDECVNAIKSAIEQGVRLIDTARAYGNEEEIGRAVREEIAAGVVEREDLFVTTKIYPGSDMADPETAIQGCLDRLDIGYVDMMLLHHPDPNDVKAYQAMEKFAADGKIRSIGLSNWYVKELEEFLPQVTTTPALVQNEIHPYYQENDVIPYIQELGIVVQGWYPLGGRGHTAKLLSDPVITTIAQAHDVSSAQVILRWNLQKGVVVIPGSSNPDHIKENTELYHFDLTGDEMARINALDRGEKHDWY